MSSLFAAVEGLIVGADGSKEKDIEFDLVNGGDGVSGPPDSVFDAEDDVGDVDDGMMEMTME